ncbi:hypothetical protein INT43_005065 [Umbelopsis isabellina]|uniref:Uncharacterized protein n=1 Tax=Mortierella isabellina TaxID=91625 RepID=A0A8H7U9S2_MORIS|nr:hypothetical protein INT43_005065 [Umbelopsis isabellina]
MAKDFALLWRGYVDDYDRGGVNDRAKKHGCDDVIPGSDCEHGCEHDYDLDYDHGLGCRGRDRGCDRDRDRVDHHYDVGQNGRDFGVVLREHEYCVLLLSGLAFSEALRFGAQ